MRVLNTNRPDHPGTVIHHGAPSPSGASAATSIAYKEGQIVATITSTRMFGEAGFLGRVFEVLGRHGVVVDMVATSEISVAFTTDRREPLDAALADLARDRRVPRGGRQDAARRGRPAPRGPGRARRRHPAAVADAGVNVEMVSYGMKSISLTMLDRRRRRGRAVSVLHRRLFEEEGAADVKQSPGERSRTRRCRGCGRSSASHREGHLLTPGPRSSGGSARRGPRVNVTGRCSPLPSPSPGPPPTPSACPRERCSISPWAPPRAGSTS